MFNFFKSNNPSVVIFYLLYLIAFRLCLIFVPVDYAYVFTYHEPLSKLFFGALQHVLQIYPYAGAVLSALLCLGQALLVNDIVNENKIMPRKNYIAGLLFIIVFSWYKDNLVLNPVSLSLTFLILLTRQIFALIKKDKAFSDVFDLGLLLAIATLFYFPSILFLIFVYVGLSAVRSFNYREWALVLIGFLAPFFILFTIYFWNDKTASLLGDITNGPFAGYKGLFSWWHTALFNSVALMVFTLAALVMLPTALFSSLIQVRKFSGVLVFLIFMIILSVVTQHTAQLSHWVLLSLPLAIIFSMVLMQIKRKWVTEVIHLMLILLLLAGQYFSFS